MFPLEPDLGRTFDLWMLSCQQRSQGRCPMSVDGCRCAVVSIAADEQSISSIHTDRDSYSAHRLQPLPLSGRLSASPLFSKAFRVFPALHGGRNS